MMARLLPILYYHHVGVQREPLGHRRLWVSRRRFAEQMAYLAEAGYRGVSLRDAAPFFEAGTSSAGRIVALTFDDGYDNFYRHAYPILAGHGFAATVFVVTGEIGNASRWDAGFETPLMGWPEIKELNAQGIEIASHTLSHPRLTRLPAQEAERELRQSRLELEDKLGTAATSLAYPYGDHNESVERMAAAAGYRLACSIRRGNLHQPAERWRLKRVPMDEFTAIPRLRRRLSALYEWTCRWQRWNRSLRGFTTDHGRP